MGFYDEIQDVASEVLAEFAQGVVTVTRPGGTIPGKNPWDPEIVVEEQVFTLSATVAAIGDEFIDGTTILATDRMVTAAAFGDVPQVGDELAIDGKVVSIVKQMRVPAAGTLIVWRWIVRG